MLVRDQMTPDPFFSSPDAALVEIHELMQEKNVRHVPILDSEESLVGLITRRALVEALPSEPDQFGPFVVNYALAKLKAENAMIRDVVTIAPDVTVEEAARVMADEKIGCLPVLEEGKLVGIISDSDLFNIMTDLLGARRPGVRLTVLQPDRAGEVARLTRLIDEKGGYISVFVTYPTDEPGTWASVVKVTHVSEDVLVEAIGEMSDATIQDIHRQGVEE
jgi:acetoin utilization protein AcuB